MARFYGLLLLICLVLLSGVIAYVGDILGRKLGRKRLSLFGLRPRYTAIVVSVLAGMGITIFTLTSAMVVSKRVRQGFFEVGELVRQLGEQRKAVLRLDRDRARLDRELTRQAESLARTSKQLTETEEKKAEAGRKLEATSKKLGATSSKLEATRRELAHTEEQLADRMQQLENAQAAFLRVQEVAEARAAERAAVVRTEPFLFAAGEALGQEIFPGDEPKRRIRRRLEGLISRMRALALEAGARRNADLGPLVIVEPVKDPKAERTVVFSQEQVVQALVDAIADNKGSVVVRGYSLVNTVEGESVPVRFVVFQNKQVFSKGTKLGEIRVAAGSPEPELMTAIVVQLLRGQVAALAREKNVMPELPQRGEGRTLFGSPPQAVGRIPFEDLYRAVEEIKAKTGIQRAIALAGDDVWTAGPLEIELEIRPLS